MPRTIQNQAHPTHSACGTVGLPNGECDNGSHTRFAKHYKDRLPLTADENPAPLND
ncbi:hypothetical protein [Gimesia sp.]|uniref:hypothetical protein n=1 Tax=Gimesia sp. TaxID=2024833 RepID=UPI0025C2172D|nr:hypothetical protein [Gimesia sp.]